MSKHDWQDEQVSGAYRAQPGAEPPAALDDAIRAAARRAVHARPQSTWKPRLLHWSLPLATAATIVLSGSLLLVLNEERPALLQSSPLELTRGPMEAKIVSPQAEMPSLPALRLDLPSATGEAKVAAVTEAQPVPPPEVMLNPADLASTRDRISRQALAKPAAPAMQEPPQVILKNLAGADAAKPAETVAPAGAEKKEAQASGAIAAAAPRAKTDAAMAASAEARLQKDHAPSPAAVAAAPPPAVPAVVTQSTIAAPPVYAPPRAAAAPVPAKREDTSGERKLAETAQAPTAPAAMASEKVQSVPVAPNSPRASAPAKPAAADRVEKIDVTGSRIDAPEPPGAWIARMEVLRMAGKWKELRAELERFRKTYPQAVLPKALQELPAEEK